MLWEVYWESHLARSGGSCLHGHVGADDDTALVKEIAVTPAIINDGKAGPDALPDNPGKVFADSAYRGNSPDRYALSEFQESHTRQNSTAGPKNHLTFQAPLSLPGTHRARASASF
ncbi:hypothetical protein [Ensifer aridi]|uniref:hypothetical protein n=1 Tax=Ensifer aridi TaxID=1708715 RepID=UPI00041E0BA7